MARKKMNEAQAAEIVNDALPSAIAISKDEEIGDWSLTNCGWPIRDMEGEPRHFDGPEAALEHVLGWYMRGNKKISSALKKLKESA